MESIARIAAGIVAKADREHPADALLRSELKRARGLPRDGARQISKAVFAYFRWYGWLDHAKMIEHQIQGAQELDAAFRRNPKTIPDAELSRAVPEWTQSVMEVSNDWLRSLQMEPRLWLRARPGKGMSLAERLGSTHVGGGALSDALVYEGEEDLFRTPEFQQGEFELQDVGSQVVGLVCNPKRGATWWDACAGEGGKMLHLCDLMQNKGLVWASDRVEWRLKRLKLRAARARLFNYRAVRWDGGQKLPTKAKFDGILVDAPCSGIGTWQRNPHARWTTSACDVSKLSYVQEELLGRVAASLKPGGRLIYAVCTLAKAETTGVVEAFSKRFPDLEAEPFTNPVNPKEKADSLWLWPQRTVGNGMFISAWKKSS